MFGLLKERMLGCALLLAIAAQALAGGGSTPDPANVLVSRASGSTSVSFFGKNNRTQTTESSGISPYSLIIGTALAGLILVRKLGRK